MSSRPGPAPLAAAIPVPKPVSSVHRPTPALGRCAVLVIVFIALGVALRRVDIVALASPFLLGPLLGLGRVSAGQPRVALRLGTGDLSEGEAVEATITVGCDYECDLVIVTLFSERLRPVDGRLQWVTALDADADVELKVVLVTDAWGRQTVGPAVAIFRGAGMHAAPPPIVTRQLALNVIPTTESFQTAGVVPNTIAYAGDHRSPSIGPGVEFANVRPFTPGDRLRHINWRATLRTNELHVTSTSTERSAEVIVLVDARADAGPPGNSILDVAVHAAAAIAEHYLSKGDLVGMEEYGHVHRRLPPGAGNRQGVRTRFWLMDLRAAFGGERIPAESPWLPGSSVAQNLIFVLTPLLSDHSATQLATLRARGASVVAIDTLVEGVQPSVHDEVEHVAREIWRLEREMLIGRLAELGVPTVPWAGAQSLDIVLRDLAQMASAPRMAMK